MSRGPVPARGRRTRSATSASSPSRVDLGQDLGVVEGLGEEVRRAVPHRLHGQLDRAESGDHQHADLRVALADAHQQGQAGDRAHLDVGDQDVRHPLRQHVEGMLGALGLAHLRAERLDQRAQDQTDLRLIVDDEDAKSGSFHARPRSRGQLQRCLRASRPNAEERAGRIGPAPRRPHPRGRKHDPESNPNSHHHAPTSTAS